MGVDYFSRAVAGGVGMGVSGCVARKPLQKLGGIGSTSANHLPDCIIDCARRLPEPRFLMPREGFRLDLRAVCSVGNRTIIYNKSARESMGSRRTRVCVLVMCAPSFRQVYFVALPNPGYAPA